MHSHNEMTIPNKQNSILNHSGKSKRNILRILYGFGIFSLTTVIGFTIYFYLMLNADERVSCRLTSDVIQLNDLIASMYFVKTDSGYIAIDAGFNPAFLQKALGYNGIKQQEIKSVFLTHIDSDHISGLNVLARSKVYLSKIESSRIERTVLQNMFNPLTNIFFIHRNYITLIDGEELKVDGLTVKCIGLPGHTKGSMGYIVDGKYLFTGDAFRIKNGILAEPFRKWFTDNTEEMDSSIRKVADLKGIQYIFSAHSGFTADFNFAVSGWKRRNRL